MLTLNIAVEVYGSILSYHRHSFCSFVSSFSGASLVVSTGYSIFHLIFSQYSYGMRLKTTALAKSSLNS